MQHCAKALGTLFFFFNTDFAMISVLLSQKKNQKKKKNLCFQTLFFKHKFNKLHWIFGVPFIAVYISLFLVILDTSTSYLSFEFSMVLIFI